MKQEEWNLLTGLLFMLLRKATMGSSGTELGAKPESSNSAAALGWAPGFRAPGIPGEEGSAGHIDCHVGLEQLPTQQVN